MTDARRIEKDLEGNAPGLIEVISRHFNGQIMQSEVRELKVGFSLFIKHVLTFEM
jgi:hypothetical protein